MEDSVIQEQINGELDENGVLEITVTRLMLNPISSITFTAVIKKDGELEIK